jgi:hypothetical protein
MAERRIGAARTTVSTYLTPRFRPIAIATAERNVRPTADGRANGLAGEPRWLRPPAAVEPADGTDGPAGHGSPANPLGIVLAMADSQNFADRVQALVAEEPII